MKTPKEKLEYIAKWQKDNAEKVRSYKEKWADNNKHKIKEYYEANKEEILQKAKRYRDINKEKAKEYHKKYYEEHKELFKKKAKKWKKDNPEKAKESARKSNQTSGKIWKLENIEHVRELKRQYYHKRKKEIRYRLELVIRGRIKQAMKKNYKNTKSKDLLGCSIDFLKKHLEKQFTRGMTWDNYGLYGWHIDHIKSCCKFDLSKESEQRKCFHYTNLQHYGQKII